MTTPQEIYLSLMQTIRGRLDMIEGLTSVSGDQFVAAETAAFHGRKIVEAIAFGCLVAVENGLDKIPRDARGQWNAASILHRLKKKGLTVLPSPSRIRAAEPKEQEESSATVVVEGLPDRRLSHDELTEIYHSLHAWLHEVNPYTHSSQAAFHSKHGSKLWDDLSRLRRFIERHVISIRGAGFLCVTHDSIDGQTKVLSLTKLSDGAPAA